MTAPHRAVGTPDPVVQEVAVHWCQITPTGPKNQVSPRGHIAPQPPNSTRRPELPSNDMAAPYRALGLGMPVVFSCVQTKGPAGAGKVSCQVSPKGQIAPHPPNKTAYP